MYMYIYIYIMYIYYVYKGTFRQRDRAESRGAMRVDMF